MASAGPLPTQLAGSGSWRGSGVVTDRERLPSPSCDECRHRWVDMCRVATDWMGWSGCRARLSRMRGCPLAAVGSQTSGG